MVDIHSHILYGIDDGAKTLEESLKMIKNAEEDGTTKIVATPHYCIGYGEKTYKEVKELVENLREVISKENINIEIYYGQEVYYSSRLLEDLEEETIGTINDSRYMLIELNMRELDEEVFETLYELKLEKIIPIIAHPERYTYIQKHPSKINKFIEEGCLFQLNAGSIKGKHGEKAKETAELLIKNKIYSFIGSDGHNNKTRKTGIKKAEEIARNIEEIDFKGNGEKMLLNEKIEFEGSFIERKKRKKKKGIFSFFRR